MSTPAAITCNTHHQVGLAAALLFWFLRPSAAAPSHLAWMSRLHRHSQWTADVAVSLSTNTPVNQRRRRQAGVGRDVLPLSLTFTFTVADEEIKLRLQKNQFVNTAPPVFFIRHGRVVQEKTRDLKDDVAFYQDLMMGASVMATCLDGRGYQLVGSYFHTGQEYSIEPITDAGRINHDHRIYRLTSQSHLKDDVMPLPAGVYAPDMEEVITETNATTKDRSNSKLSDRGPCEVSYNISSPDDNNIGCGSSSSISGTGSTIDRQPDTNMTSPPAGRDCIISVSSVNPPSEVTDTSHNLTAGQAKSDIRPGCRRKRQAQSYIVELAMVIDYGVYQVWHDGVTDLDGDLKRTETLRRITQFYSFILNGMDLRYSSVRRLSDFDIDVTWAGIIIMDTPVAEYWLGVDHSPTSSRGRVESSLLLETFRTWAGSLGAELPPSDHVMLFTGHNLTYGGSVSNAGLAYLGSACNLDFFFSIVEEYFDFRDVAIAAHELGHSLGARHDMDGNLCLAQDRYIMTSRFQFPSERKARNPWLFSRCSVQYFRDFIQELDRNGTNCLVVQDSTREAKILPHLMSLPGQVYSRDDFCRIGDGPSSYICREHHMSEYNNICYGGVWCYSPADRLCLPRLPPDGFSCGNQKWCMNGTCQFSDLAPVTPGDDCPFGDRPDTVADATCTDRVSTTLAECYRDTFRADCCATCLRFRHNLPGCEYGDQLQSCEKEQCLNYDLEYARDNCCDTCAEILFTLPVTMETTIAIFRSQYQPMGTSRKTEHVTSPANDNSPGWRNQIASPEINSHRGMGDRGRTWDHTAQNGRQRLWGRRAGSESQESAESDEVMSRDFGWNRNDVPGPAAGDSSRTVSADQRVLRHLLDNLRHAHQKVNRSQRMRLLTNFLERIRRQNFGHA